MKEKRHLALSHVIYHRNKGGGVASKSTVYKPGTNPGPLPDHSPAGEFPDPRMLM